MSERVASDEQARQYALDVALQGLSRVDLEPFTAQRQRVAAERRLAQVPRPLTRVQRCEQAALMALSTAHLLWALTQVLGLRP